MAWGLPSLQNTNRRGRVKIHWVPGPGASTGGQRTIFVKNDGVKSYFRDEKGAKTFFKLIFSQTGLGKVYLLPWCNCSEGPPKSIEDSTKERPAT